MKGQRPSHVHISNEAYDTVIAALYASIGEVQAAGSLGAKCGGNERQIDELLTLVEKRLATAADILVDTEHHHVAWELPCECTTPAENGEVRQ